MTGRSLRVAILANNRDSFVRPTAEGLQRMLCASGADAWVGYDGLHHLGLPTSVDWSSARSIAGTALRLLPRRRQLSRFVNSIRGCDVVVVVANVPLSFSRVAMPNIELLRRLLPSIPIVNYDLHYLPTIVKWGRAILNGEDAGLTDADMQGIERGVFGMDRYDWYLMVSTASELAMPPGAQPCTVVGIDLDDGTLYPAQDGNLRALVDFAQERKDYPSYRAMQISALEQVGIPYEVLKGNYSSAEIRAIYRRTGIFFLAHRESFGLPICELQACGSLIFSPHSSWAGAHWMKDDPASAGPGVHSPNFRIYDNDIERLSAQLEEVKRTFNPARVVATFNEYQPQLFRGDRAAVNGFLEMVKSGAIHGGLHTEHASVGREQLTSAARRAPASTG